MTGDGNRNCNRINRRYFHRMAAAAGWDTNVTYCTLTGPTINLPPNLDLHFVNTPGLYRQMNVHLSSPIPERVSVKWRVMAIDPTTWTPWTALGPVTKWIDDNIGEYPATGHIVIDTRENTVSGFIKTVLP
jgi:hypothetical protein